MIEMALTGRRAWLGSTEVIVILLLSSIYEKWRKCKWVIS